MRRWKHPLHADRIANDEQVGQLPPKLLLVALELADLSKSGAHTSEKQLRKDIKTMLEVDPEAIHASDFIGPDAALRICERLPGYLPLDLLKKLKDRLPSPESVDCYRNNSPLKRLLIKEIGKALVKDYLKRSSEIDLEI
jgi:hypothetical protein